MPLAGGPDSENSHDLLPKLIKSQTGLVSVLSLAIFPSTKGQGIDSELRMRRKEEGFGGWSSRKSPQKAESGS